MKTGTMDIGGVSSPTVAQTVETGCGQDLNKSCWARPSRVTLPSGVATLIVRSDPTRTRLSFSIMSAALVAFDTRMDLDITTGIPIDGPDTFVITPSDLGQLATFDWYAFQQTGAPIPIVVNELFQR